MSYKSDLESIDGIGSATSSKIIEEFPTVEDLLNGLGDSDLLEPFELELMDMFGEEEEIEDEDEGPSQENLQKQGEQVEKVLDKRLAHSKLESQKVRAHKYADSRRRSLIEKGMISG